jgi:DHA3 family macrolide efflux protein-like MFS transporter
MQTVIRADMQGRVFSLIVSATMAMTPLGLVIAGPVADAAGVPVWFLMGGAVTTILMIVGFLTPSVLKLEDAMVEQQAVEEK